jgi:hypothetical protein
MAKKKPDQPNPEEQAIEERVRQMMEPEAVEPSAPPLGKKSRSIQIKHHDDAETDIAAAIEEANEQLRAATAPELNAAESKGPIKIVPTEHDEEEAPALVEEEASRNETKEIAEDETLEQSLDETATEEPDNDIPATDDEAEKPVDDSPASTDAEENPIEEQGPAKIEPDEVAEPETPSVEPDEETNKAVDEIVAKESDDVLESEDRERELVEAFRRPKPTLRQKLGNFFSKPVVRWVTLIVIVGGIIAAGIVPDSRYFVLNTAGVRSSASLLVLDESTQQPLKNVTVRIDGQSGKTGDDGKVTLANLRLGRSEITIEKLAFAPVTRTHVFGWGSNPLGDFSLKPVGTQYAFMVTDFVSGKPIAKVEALSDDASAFSDEKGAIKLTTDRKDDSDLEVTIKAEGYREEKFTIPAADTQEKNIQLVLARKHVFVSKRSGKFDVYKVDIDGKNEERILAGTGTEREDIVIVPHPTAEVVAVVSSRENKRNKDGFLLSTLTLIDLKSNEVKAVTASERVHVVDWIGSRLVYVRVAEGESTSSPKRHRLMSYEYKDETNKELAASNFFNDVVVALGKIYYAPSTAYQEGGDTGLFKLEADGSGKQTITSKETWNIFRTSHDHLTLAMPQLWYDYRLGEKSPVKLDGPPAIQTTRVYADSPDGKRSLWVDNRDGKGVLIYYDVTGKTDSVIRTQSGLKNPVRWLNNSILVFRIHTDEETADFALSVEGGEAKKIRDVTNTDGIDSWYYY